MSERRRLSLAVRVLRAATENMDLIVWKGCAVGEPNEQFAVEAGHLKVQDPAKAATPCLQAMPCVAPCVLPSGWGVRPHSPLLSCLSASRSS